MGKRQQRYFKGDITNASLSIIGKLANITLSNNAVFAGKVVHIDSKKITIKSTHTSLIDFPLSDIVALVTDSEASY